eukprot:1194461-Prorocentrum_minimum.AAC.1
MPQDALQLLDVVLKHTAAYRKGWWLVGRGNNLIFPPQARPRNPDLRVLIRRTVNSENNQRI